MMVDNTLPLTVQCSKSLENPYWNRARMINQKCNVRNQVPKLPCHTSLLTSLPINVNVHFLCTKYTSYFEKNVFAALSKNKIFSVNRTRVCVCELLCLCVCMCVSVCMYLGVCLCVMCEARCVGFQMWWHASVGLSKHPGLIWDGAQ